MGTKNSMDTINKQSRLPQKLALLFGLPAALALVALVAGMAGDGGHPPLGAVLVLWAIYPTLTGYLSRAFLGSDFPSFFIMLLGLMEYPLVGFGLGSIIARAKAWTDRRTQIGAIAFLGYMSAQLAAHILLNLPVVNLKLVSHASPGVSEAAVDRLRRSGHTDSLPTLQQKLVEDLAHQGAFPRADLLDALTQLGGAKGWQDLVESRRLGVARSDARTWRFVINNVREMTNPAYAAPRGGVKSPYLRDEDIARLFDALALKLAEHLEVTADSEASLTLLTLMKGRQDLCSLYFEKVPNGLRDQVSQATYEIVGNLAAIKLGNLPDNAYSYQTYLSREEIVRIGREPAVIADEWAAWAKSDASPCHPQ
jgi:hypothetical protein